VLLSNEDVEHGKPAPDIYLATSEKLCVPPHQCLVVEDNPKGIESAERAGCPVMVVETVFDVTLENIQKRINEIELACP
jgi:beta-phosphoglucomutase-like phosphatase (HAD superfamily)